MLYNKGDLVQYKKYLGRIHFGISENKTYIVTLFNYNSFPEIDKQISQVELYQAYEQLAIMVI